MGKDFRNLWDHITQVRSKKESGYWDSLSESERKQWNTYMVNRGVSMNPDLCPVVNEVQHLTMEMPDEAAYRMYKHLLPPDDTYYKYVKKKEEGSDFPKDWMIEYLVDFYGCSVSEAKEYFEIFMKDEKHKSRFKEVMRNYPLEEDEVKDLKQI
jgi:uncharacterized protein YcsI (UPF0317 family)